MRRFFNDLFNGSNVKVQSHACELCGKVSSQSTEYLLVEADYVIKLSSPLIRNHDKNSQTVTLSDDTIVDYDAISSGLAFKYRNVVTNHQFCSENCLDEVIKSPISMGDALFDAIGVLALKNSMSDLSWRIAVTAGTSTGNDRVCDVCGRKYFNTHTREDLHAPWTQTQMEMHIDQLEKSKHDSVFRLNYL